MEIKEYNSNSLDIKKKCKTDLSFIENKYLGWQIIKLVKKNCFINAINILILIIKAEFNSFLILHS